MTHRDKILCQLICGCSTAGRPGGEGYGSDWLADGGRMQEVRGGHGCSWTAHLVWLYVATRRTLPFLDLTCGVISSDPCLVGPISPRSLTNSHLGLSPTTLGCGILGCSAYQVPRSYVVGLRPFCSLLLLRKPIGAEPDWLYAKLGVPRPADGVRPVPSKGRGTPVQLWSIGFAGCGSGCRLGSGVGKTVNGH